MAKMAIVYLALENVWTSIVSTENLVIASKTYHEIMLRTLAGVTASRGDGGNR